MRQYLTFIGLAIAAAITMAAYPYVQITGGKILVTGGKIQFASGGLDIPDLIAHWKLNDNAGDLVVVDSKGTNTGTAQQNTSGMATNGKINGALVFNGTSDYVDFGNVASLDINTNSISISVWVNTTVTTHSRIYSKGSHGYGMGYALIMYGPRSGGIGTATLLFSPSPSGTTEFLCDSDSPIGDGSWKHIVGIIDRIGNLEMYINNVKQAATTDISAYSTNNVGSGSLNASLGVSLSVSGAPGIDEYFEGIIDDVRIYKRVLTTNEIAQIYNGGIGTEEE